MRPSGYMLLLDDCDWNGVENALNDRRSGVAGPAECDTRPIFDKLNSENFKDVWRERNPLETQFSYHGRNHLLINAAVICGCVCL